MFCQKNASAIITHKNCFGHKNKKKTAKKLYSKSHVYHTYACVCVYVCVCETAAYAKLDSIGRWIAAQIKLCVFAARHKSQLNNIPRRASRRTNETRYHIDVERNQIQAQLAGRRTQGAHIHRKRV